VLAVVGAVSALSATTLAQTVSKGAKAQPVTKQVAAPKKAPPKPVVNRKVAPPLTPKRVNTAETGVTASTDKGMSPKFSDKQGVQTPGTFAGGPTLSTSSKNVGVAHHAERGPGAANNCGDAATVGEGTFNYDLAGATNDYPGICGGTGTAEDVWYRYVPSANGNATIATCGLTSGDSVLSAIDECGGATLVCVDDACGLQSSITIVGAVAGEDYYIRIADFAGGTHAGQIAITLTPAGPCTTNDCCGAATNVTVPSTNNYDLNGLTNDWPGTCGGTGTAADQWFVFTAPSTGTAVVSTCGLTSGDTVLSILDECGGPQILCLDDFCGLQTEVSFAATSGEDYYIRIAGFAGGVHAGQFSVSMQAPCVLTPPGAGSPEGEDCGSDTNGGCNMASPAFGTISCGGVVNGTAWAAAGTRDTDWYDLNLDGPHQVTIRGQAQFPLRLFVLDTNCPPAIISTINVNRCEIAEITALVSGSCRIFAGNNGFDGNPCGADNDYWISVTNCTPVKGPANDDCADAEDITGSGPFNFDNTIASTDGFPDPACLSFGLDDITNDLWYDWTASCNEGDQATLEFCGLTAIDSRVAIYDGDNCPVGAAVACNDDSCGLQSRVRWIPTPGQVYKIRIGNFPGAAGGPGAFVINCAPAPVPVCTAFDPGTDCQTSSFAIAYNATNFTLAESFNSTGTPLSSICLNGLYFNNAPVTDNWVISVAQDTGTGVPGAIIDTFTQGVDMTVSGPTPTGAIFVGRDVMEWRMDFSRPVAATSGQCLWIIMNNFASGDSVFMMDGDASNGNLQAAQDLNQDGIFQSPGEVVTDDIYLCVNDGFLNNQACLVDPCAGQTPTNDDCGNAVALTAGESVHGNTGCATPESIASCSGSAWANAVWYQVSGNGNSLTVDLCASAFYDTRLEVYCGDCSNPVCIGSNDDACGLQSSVTWCSQAGGNYLVAVHGFGGDSGEFDITLTSGEGCANPPECAPCLGIDPNPAANAEGEDCGLDTNGGCNATPNAYRDVTCNETVNGTTWASGGTRDTDWYRVTVPASGNVSATVSTEVPVVVFILTVPTCDTIGLAASIEVAPCGTGTISASLPAGSQAVVFVAPGNLSAGIFDGFACGQGVGNDYTVSFDVGNPCSAPCPCDFNNNGVLNSQDFFDFLACFFTNGCPAGDYNDDGFVNSQDFFDFLACFFAPPAGCN
jgi:hypothetical protein